MLKNSKPAQRVTRAVLTTSTASASTQNSPLTPTLPALIPIARSKPLLGWSRATSYRLAAQGAIQVVRVGRAAFVTAESAAAYIEGLVRADSAS